MTEEQEPLETVDEAATRERWAAAAICLGYNELAKLGKTLGEKVYFRMFRQTAEEEFMRRGGKRVFQEEPPILTLELQDGMPWIRFSERDIELMRATVVEYDARAASEKERGDA